MTVDLKRIYDRLAEHYQQRLEQTDCGDDILELEQELAHLGFELGLPQHEQCSRCDHFLLPRDQGECGYCDAIAAGVREFLRFMKWGPTGRPPPPPFCRHGVRREEGCFECEREVRLYIHGIVKRPVT